ncbi:hypothetical protein [Streptomyces sp. NPDC002845]
MTTAARRPSPADLATRHNPPTTPTPPPAPPVPAAAEEAAIPAPSPAPDTASDIPAPGKLRDGEVMRSMYAQAIRISRLRPEARLVALSLLSFSNFRTGRIRACEKPGLRQLSYATGLTMDTAHEQVQVLTQQGWLRSRVLTVGPHAGEDVLQLCVPAQVLDHLRARHAQTHGDGAA